jgi:hypothetical protein
MTFRSFFSSVRHCSRCGRRGAFGGYEVRKRLVRALKAPDFVIALLEDAVAIGGGLLIVAVLSAQLCLDFGLVVRIECQG